jgi:hypothetical protein
MRVITAILLLLVIGAVFLPAVSTQIQTTQDRAPNATNTTQFETTTQALESMGTIVTAFPIFGLVGFLAVILSAARVL